MKFTKKTQLYETTIKSYHAWGYVCFRYTGQKSVRQYAGSIGAELLTIVLWNPDKRCVMSIFPLPSTVLNYEKPLKKVEIP